MSNPMPASCQSSGSPASSGSLLVVISAPSGGGKTTLCQQLLAASSGLARAITCTTRAPRAGEQDGVDYYFLDRAEFERKVAAGEFLEHAVVYGNYYGVLKAELLSKLRQGLDVLLNVDVQGCATIRARAMQDAELRRALVMVFLTPPSLEVLEERLRKRATDASDVIERRLAAAREEIAQARHFDYLVISTTIQEDVRRAQALLEAEKMRVGRVVLPGVPDVSSLAS